MVPPGTAQEGDPTRLARFDKSWRTGTPPRLEDFLADPKADLAFRRGLLEELIKIDLEYRWRWSDGVARAGELPVQPLLEDYARRFVELGRPEQFSLGLIEEEYRVRQRWGDRPGRAEYVTRFSRRGPELAEALARVDADLAAEFTRSAGVPLAPTGPGAAPPRSCAALLEILKSSNLLTPAQLAELPPGHGADPRDLARDLLRRDWLTPYQINLLLQGRGHELVLGPYLLLERLGEGGAGQVFKARHQRLNRTVAVKMIRKELLTDPEVVGRFYREVQVVGQLDHVHIVRAYDAGPVGATHFLAMEFVEGTDLARLVKQGGPLPVDKAVDYVRQAALGLQHAHEKDLVHRDIKPHNLMRTRVGDRVSSQSPARDPANSDLIKLLDLGLARLQPAANGEVTAALSHQGASSLTPVGAVMMGTADYLAPEQALDFHRADIRADIYSLGCTLFYLLTGQPPFPGGTLAQKVAHHLQAVPPAIESLRTDVPAPLGKVVRKMLAKKPEDRYQTPADLAAALAGLSHQGGRPSKRQRAIQLSLITAVVLIGAVLVWFLSRPSQTRQSGATDAPSPLDQLSQGRFPGLPKEVVAVLGKAGDPPACGLAFRPDGRRLAVARPDGVINLWDPVTDEKAGTLKGSAENINRLAFSPNGKFLGAAGATHGVKLWNVTERAELPLPKPPKTGCVAVAISPDGRYLAAADRVSRFALYDMMTPSNEPRIIGAKGPGLGFVNSLAFSPDGQMLATGHYESAARLWNLKTGTKEATAPGSHCNVVAFAPDGKTFAVGADSKPHLQLWHLDTRVPQTLPQGKGYTRFVAFAFGGRTLLWMDSPILKGINLGDGTEDVKTWPLPAPGTVVAIAPDGRHVAVAHPSKGTVYILRLTPKK